MEARHVIFRALRKRGFYALAAAILFTWMTPAAQASTIVFAYNNSSTIDVKAQFDVDNAAKTVSIYLLNLQNNPTSILSVLGSVRFNVIGAGINPDPIITGSSFSTFDIDKRGSPLSHPGAPNAWQADNIGGNTVAFCATCAAGGNTELLIGGPGPDGIYSGNGSIGPAHSPYIIGSGATYSSGALAGLDTTPGWTLYFGGISSQQVMISNVIFGFGTGAGYGTDFYSVPAYTEMDTPEPETKMMMATGIGLVLLAVAARRMLVTHRKGHQHCKRV
jgi:hypothetical protein